MVPTPPAALALCQEAKLLRPICPQKVPRAAIGRSGQRWLAVCTSTHGNGGAMPLTSHRCVAADWSYEASGSLPGLTPRSRLARWDGRRWIAIPAEAGMEPPPVHVHVDIGASVGTPPVAVATAGSPAGGDPATDALLNPARTRAVSLGWVRWHGYHGQLVLAPLYPTGAELGGVTCSLSSPRTASAMPSRSMPGFPGFASTLPTPPEWSRSSRGPPSRA